MPDPTALPQLAPRLFLTDGGLETTLIFHGGFELPDFAAFPLIETEVGRAALEQYYRSYIEIAERHATGIVLETPTWRASADWGDRLGYSPEALRAVNAAAVELLQRVRAEHAAGGAPIVISGNLGPRGDGYAPSSAMSATEAEQYHREQVESLVDAGAELITALTITNVDEAIGIVRAAVSVDAPVVISFTVEVDGLLPSGQRLVDAIAELDAATAAGAAYVMVNCAHPTHLMPALEAGSPTLARIRGVRANASTRSHAELDEADELDAGDPADLGQRYRELTALLPALTIMGGCCGTDDRHIDTIAAACAPLFAARE